MRRIIVIAALPLCLVGAHHTAAPILSCEAITNRTTMAELQQKYGDFDASERLDVRWADAQQTRMAALWTTDRKSVWRSANGIYVGMKIADLDLLNERQFPLRGFETDDPGLVLSWAGGKLEPATNGPSTGSGQGPCRLVVRLAPTVFEFTTAEWRLIEPIQFTAEVSSDDKRIKPYKAVVSAIGLEWR
jgi:hypothetical protein